MAKSKIQRKSTKKKKKAKVSHLRKPEDMNLQQWQVALRKEFGGVQNFRLKNIGSEPIFSEYTVFNPQTKREYRVAIRGESCGDNFCSCPEFSVNTLGTCKHIEFTLTKLRRKRGGARTLGRDFLRLIQKYISDTVLNAKSYLSREQGVHNPWQNSTRKIL